jgi:hypothetical protein
MSKLSPSEETTARGMEKSKVVSVTYTYCFSKEGLVGGYCGGRELRDCGDSMKAATVECVKG